MNYIRVGIPVRIPVRIASSLNLREPLTMDQALAALDLATDGPIKRALIQRVRYLRWRDRKRGHEIPRLRADVRGAKNPMWLGDKASVHAGRLRAQKLFPDIGPCVKCGKQRAERHHKDHDTHNNARSNIEALCRMCHMISDGRAP